MPKREKKKFVDVESIECKEHIFEDLHKEHWDYCTISKSSGETERVDNVINILTDRHNIEKLVSDDDLFYVKFIRPQDIRLYKHQDAIIDLNPAVIKGIAKKTQEQRKKIAPRSKFQQYVKTHHEIP